MLARHISGMPVVDGDGKLLGMVSEGDLIRRVELGSHRPARSWWLELLTTNEEVAQKYVKSHGSRVDDVMTQAVTTVTPDTDIAQVAMVLEKNRIKRVPVVEGGRLVGIVSRADLLRAFAVADGEGEASRDDASLRARLVEHLAGQPWAGATVNVIVSDGTVSLWGICDSAEQHEAYLVAARETPGVRGVEDHMVRAPVA
jgi:CBS domain-containing protein